MQTGFSLLELLIALVIISILSAVCLPVYSAHLIHEKRLEAEMSLVKLSSEMEQYHIQNNTYKNATLMQLGLPDEIAGHQYRIMIAAADENDFLLKAIPQDKQATRDLKCATLSLDSTGKKEITGTGNLTDCWQSL